MQETQVWSLGREDPLEEEKAPHSIIFAWKILWAEEPGEQQSMLPQRVRQTEHPHMRHFWMCINDSLALSYFYKKNLIEQSWAKSKINLFQEFL